MRPQSQGFDGQFQIVSLEDIADFVAAEAAARGRIGLVEAAHSCNTFGMLDSAASSRFSHPYEPKASAT